MFGAQQPPTGPSSMTRSSSFGGGPSAKKATFSFGNPSTTNTTTQPATTGFSFGQSQQNTQPSTSTTANTGFSFGASTNNQTQPAAPASSGFSFGNNNNNNNTTSTTGGGLFGNNNNNNSQPQSTGFSFGNNQQTQQNQQQQPQSTGAFSFGQSTAQKPAGTFSFGNSTNNNASISQPQQQQQGGISLFGQSQNQPAGFGQSTNQSSSPFSSHPYYQKEKFDELPERERKLIEELDNHILSQTRIRDELLTKEFGNEEVRKVLQMCGDIQDSLRNLDSSLSTDQRLVQDLSTKLNSDRNDYSKLHEIAENVRRGGNDGSVWKDFPLQVYTKEAQEFRERANRYWATMEQLERTISTVDGGRNQPSPQAIEDAILSQHSSFMSFASQIADLHSDVESIKRDYRNWYQAQFRSVVDPFAGIEST